MVLAMAAVVPPMRVVASSVDENAVAIGKLGRARCVKTNDITANNIAVADDIRLVRVLWHPQIG